MGADCKSAGVRLRWFESTTLHPDAIAAARGIRRLTRPYLTGWWSVKDSLLHFREQHIPPLRE